MSVRQVQIEPTDPARFAPVLEDRWPAFEEAISKAREIFSDRVVWNVNSTATGGGVAEMLRPLVGYIRGAGIDARWAVIGGDQDFFLVTKRLHNRLHGVPGDGGSLDEGEKAVYAESLDSQGRDLAELISPGDVVILHDPQTAGLVSAMKDAGALVVWRCHVGLDTPNEHAREAWAFLRPWVSPADAYVFSREVFAWDDLDRDKIAIIPPSIDVFSPKNADMDGDDVGSIIGAAGLVASKPNGAARFRRSDGTDGSIEHRARFEGAGPPPEDARLVVQISRWDRLKDPAGVIKGFADHVAQEHDAHLLLAGPSVEGVADDPEGAQTLQEVAEVWEGLDGPVRERVHLAILPMDDEDENAAIVNALQRRADVVVQKSLAEGFGLTVAEAMWKARPVVASRIGGIQDQIDHGRTGLLVDDPSDLAAFGAAVSEFLSDPTKAINVGRAAHDSVRDRFLGPRHLMRYLDLIEKLL